MTLIPALQGGRHPTGAVSLIWSISAHVEVARAQLSVQPDGTLHRGGGSPFGSKVGCQVSQTVSGVEHQLETAQKTHSRYFYGHPKRRHQSRRRAGLRMCFINSYQFLGTPHFTAQIDKLIYSSWFRPSRSPPRVAVPDPNEQPLSIFRPLPLHLRSQTRVYHPIAYSG